MYILYQEYKKTWKWKFNWFYRTIIGRLEVLEGLKAFLKTLEVKEIIKPFDLEAYKKGAKIQTRDGHKVRIVCTDAENLRFPIIALVTNVSLSPFPFL